MPKILDLTGKKFGKLTAIRFANEYDSLRNRIWLCKCECGNLHKVAATRLVNGSIRSCGCTWKEAGNRVRDSVTTHGQSRTRLYSVWSQMRYRCRKGTKYSKWYSDRGISVCDEWNRDFLVFYKWSLENGYKPGLTIDRINNNGNYEPSNCRWVPMKVQANNTRRNFFYTHNGETKTLQQWSDETGIRADCIRDRILRGWSADKVFDKENHKLWRANKKGACQK